MKNFQRNSYCGEFRDRSRKPQKSCQVKWAKIVAMFLVLANLTNPASNLAFPPESICTFKA